MKRFGITVFCTVPNCAFAILFLYYIRNWPASRNSPSFWNFIVARPIQPEFEYKDFISIILTALGVMIGILAAIFALAAIWGFGAIRDAAVIAAEKIAEVTAKDVATTVAVRIARETEPGETAVDVADRIVIPSGGGEH